MRTSRLLRTVTFVLPISLLFSVTQPNFARPAQKATDQENASRIDQLLAEAQQLLGAAKAVEGANKAQQALDLSRVIDDKLRIGRSLFFLAFADSLLGKLRKAIETYNEAALELEQAGEKRVLGRTLNNLATLFSGLGEHEKAIEYYGKASAMHHEYGGFANELQSQANIAFIYVSLGEYERAEAIAQETLRKSRELKARLLESRALHLLGNLESLRRRYRVALSYFEQAITINHEMKDETVLQDNLRYVAAICAELGDYEKAAEFGRQALQSSSATGNRLVEAHALQVTGYVQAKQGKLSEALTSYSQSRKLFQQMEDARNEALACTALGGLQRALGHEQEALNRFREALALIKKVRASAIPTESFRAGLNSVSDVRTVFSNAVDLLVALKQESEALQVAEQYRARAFLDQLAESRVDARQDLSEADREREDQIFTRISTAQRQLFQPNLSAGRETQLKAELATAENALEAFQLALRRSSPRYANVQYTETLGVAEIQKRLLSADTTLIEFMLGEQRSFVWAISASHVVVAILPARKQIEESITAYRAALTTRASALTFKQSLTQLQSQSRRLYETLILPVEKTIASSNRLIIVPDGALAYLPFETLIAGESDGKIRNPQSAVRNQEYLLERFAIAYAPSATALAAINEKAGNPTSQLRTLLAFGDPVYREDRTSAAKPADGRPQSADETRPSPAERGLDLVSLPYTREEIAGISAIYGSGKSKIYLGAAAREESVKAEKLDAYRYLHFAAHGTVNEEHPARSGIVLSLSDRSKEDGLLRVSEVMRLKMSAEMVTLSACSTGLGRLLDGEGFIGLSRAFFYSGARSVVVSLWNVNDIATAQLMKSFYHNLSRGLAKDEALRQAKRGLIKAGQQTWRHPYYWAAFVLMGESK